MGVVIAGVGGERAVGGGGEVDAALGAVCETGWGGFHFKS